MTMDDHPDLKRIRTSGEAPHEKLVQAQANALNVATLTVLMAAIPCIVWLWTWAL